MAKKKQIPRKKRSSSRLRSLAKYQIASNETIEYKNFELLQRFLNDRGKIVPRRISGVTARQQRDLSVAIKRARYLALLTSGGIKK